MDHYTIDQECLASIVTQYTINYDHSLFGSTSKTTVNHPSFAYMRENMIGRGLVISNEYNDVVLKRFSLNGVVFNRDDQFPGARSMRNTLRTKPTFSPELYTTS